MKVGGRIIQNKNISINNEERFSAVYKKHTIEISLHKKEKNSNPEWYCDIRSLSGGLAVQTTIKRCAIHDAIVYSLDEAVL